FKNSIIVAREHHGRYEKIPELIKSQPDRGSLGIGERFWTNEYAPCAIRGELIDSLTRRVRCEEVARAVKGHAETAARNKPKRSSPPLGGKFKDYRDVIRRPNRHDKQIVRAVNRHALSEKGIWYGSKHILRAVRHDFQ